MGAWSRPDEIQGAGLAFGWAACRPQLDPTVGTRDGRGLLARGLRNVRRWKRSLAAPLGPRTPRPYTGQLSWDHLKPAVVRRPIEVRGVKIGRFSNVVSLALLAFSLFPRDVAAQRSAAEEPPEIPVRVIDGRLYAKAQIQGAGPRVPIHLLVDFASPGPFALHVNTARLLELQPGQGVKLTFRGFEMENLVPDVSRIQFLEGLTAEYAQELEEIPVSGILGLRAFPKTKRLELNLRRGLIRLLDPPAALDEPPPAENVDQPMPVADAWKALERGTKITFPYEERSDGVRFQVRLEDQLLTASLATGELDTWIRPGKIDLERDVPERLRLQDIEITRHVALRPGDKPFDVAGGVDVVLGTNFLADYILTLDPRWKVGVLEALTEPVDPSTDRAGFRALASAAPDALDAFYEANKEHRLAKEVGVALLRARLGERDVDTKALVRAVEVFAATTPAKRRSRVLLDMLGQMERFGLSDENQTALRGRSLELALEASKEDEDAEAVHKTRREIGTMLLEEGDLDQAHRHLLSAAFGMPRDGMVNLRLGQLYEKMDKQRRAWSRFLQAAITADAGPEGMKGLERIADAQGITTPYDVDEMERAIEGRIPAFEPASVYAREDGTKPSRTVLAELFTGAHCKPCGPADLAFDGLLAHFAHGEVAIIEHHLHIPAPEPLVSPAAMERGREMGVRGTPTVVLDGVERIDAGGRIAQAGASFRKIRDAVEKRLEEETPWTITIEGQLEGEELAVDAVVHGPAADGLRLNLYLCEKKVLFPGASTIVLHRFVNRYELTLGGARLESEAGARRVSRSVILPDVTFELEDHLDQVEQQAGRPFPMRPVAISPKQVAVVGFLQDRGGAILQAAVWEAVPSERDR